jgi:tetratricopeptide (TPR) repeat protein
MKLKVWVSIFLTVLLSLIGCGEDKAHPQNRLSTSLDHMLQKLDQEEQNLQVQIENQIAKGNPRISPNLLLLSAAIASSNDELTTVRQSLDTLMRVKNLSDDQLGLTYLLEATRYYALGQVTRLDDSLNKAILKLDDTSDPGLKLWLEANKVLIAAFRHNNVMFDEAVNYVLPRIETAPNNLLGQFMLNMIAIGLTTEERFNDAINVESIKVSRDEALGNVKGLSDSYYNLGNIYRKLLQPELALLNFMQCLDYSEQLGSSQDQAFALQQMAVVALELEDNDRAKQWARDAHSLAISSNSQQLYIPTKVALAKAIADEKPMESAALLKEARTLSSKLNVTHFMAEIEAIERKLVKIEGVVE